MDGSDWFPVWTPDGKRLAFTSDRDGDPDIFVADADGANPINLTAHPGIDVSPAWRPVPLLTSVQVRSWGQIKRFKR